MTRSGQWEEEEGWWKCDFWEKLSFKFKDEGEQLERCGRWDPDSGSDEFTIQLQLALQHATHLSADYGIPDISSDLLQSLSNILQEGDNPVPVLENLIFYGCGSDELRPFLDAAMARKLVQLKSVKVSCVKAPGTAQHLAKVIESGNLPNLSALSVLTCDLDSDGLRSLAASLKKACGSLRDLDLSQNPTIGREGHLALAEVMKAGHLVHLKTLILYGAGMDAVSCAAYAQALVSGNVQALKLLNFANNIIRSEGHLALAKAFGSGQLQCLESLSLGATGMDAASCMGYSKALISGHVRELHKVGFGFNDFGNDAMKALCPAFASGKLRTIWLQDDEIGDEGMEAIVQCMKAGQLKDLVDLDLSGDRFSKDGYSLLGSALASGAANSLQTLNLSHNFKDVRENILPILEAFSYNRLLVAKVDWEWHKFPDLDLQMKKLRHQNLRHLQILKDLGGPNMAEVAATHGKVYLCGNPMAGKTTLRKSMQRSLGKSLSMRERRAGFEERTRGINVTQLRSPGKDGLSLAIFDMAGQEEYHLVHHVFLRDLSSVNGNATSFVIVCRSEQDQTKIVKSLAYWLRFIASSSNKEIGNPPHVFVVINRIDGDSRIVADTTWWRAHLEDMREKYKEFLAIRKEPYILDVRKRKFVLGLKQSLFEHSKKILHGKKVPKICHMLQEKLNLWCREREEFPVLHWIKFFKKVEEMDPSWLEVTIEAATRYLHEAGVLIYISMESLVDLHVEHSGKGLVILDPNWMCKEVVGSIILPKEMTTVGEQCLREEVDQNNGSISIGGLLKFFRSKHNEWTPSELDDIRAILLKLGLCFQGVKDLNNLYLPCLIKEEEHESNGQYWCTSYVKSKHKEGQWVMGYSVESEKSDIVLAPLALWYSFQVELAQSPEYTNSSFKVSKTSIGFTYKGMVVLIEVILEFVDNPTFDSIDVFVKPMDAAAKTTRRAQLDLAHDLINKLLQLWNKVCPAVCYVERVVWPWPASQLKPPLKSKIRDSEVQKFLQDKRSLVNEVRKRVQEHGVGEELDLRVGKLDTITCDELLSSKHLGDTTKSVQDQIKSLQDQLQKGLHVWSKGMQEAIEEGILSSDDFRIQEEDDASSSTSLELVSTEKFKPTEADHLVLEQLDAFQLYQLKCFEKLDFHFDNLQGIAKKNLNLNKEIVKVVKDNQRVLQDVYMELQEVKVQQKLILEKVQDFQSFYLEDKEQSCPRFIYLVAKDAGRAPRWVTLKRAMALSVKVHVHFVCEAQYDIHGQHGLHAVKNQQGIDVSNMKEWARKLAPWLKVSLTVVFITGMVAANLAAPGAISIVSGVGEMFPNFMQMQKSSLADLLIAGIGCSQEELDREINEGEKPSATSTLETPRKLCGSTREYMTELLAGLSVRDFQEKVSLMKVSLKHKGKSDASVLWICEECYKKYGDSESTTIHELNRLGNR